MLRTNVGAGRLAVPMVAAAIPVLLSACIINGSTLTANGNAVDANVAVGGQGPSASPSSSNASDSITVASPSSQDDWRNAFSDYDIPSGTMSVKTSVVLRKRGVHPPTAEMFRVNWEGCGSFRKTSPNA